MDPIRKLQRSIPADNMTSADLSRTPVSNTLPPPPPQQSPPPQGTPAPLPVPSMPIPSNTPPTAPPNPTAPAEPQPPTTIPVAPPDAQPPVLTPPTELVTPTAATDPTAPRDPLLAPTPLAGSAPAIYSGENVSDIPKGPSQEEIQRGLIGPSVEASTNAEQLFNERVGDEIDSQNRKAYPSTYVSSTKDFDAYSRYIRNSIPALINSYGDAYTKAQTVQAQNNVLLNQQMAAALFANSPQGSATEQVFNGLAGWFSDTFTDEGGRQYVRPYGFDKRTGEYTTNFPGALMYGLGILQNSVMGVAMDARDGVSMAYSAFTPQWLRNQFTAAGDAGMSNPLTAFPTAVISGIGQILTAPRRDNKSNFIEALRGAQYSFSDPVGSGFGIKSNVGVRIGEPAGQGWGFDVNPTALAGFGADVIIGGKVDKLLPLVNGKSLFKRGKGGFGTVGGNKGGGNIAPPLNPLIPQPGVAGTATASVPPATVTVLPPAPALPPFKKQALLPPAPPAPPAARPARVLIPPPPAAATAPAVVVKARQVAAPTTPLVKRPTQAATQQAMEVVSGTVKTVDSGAKRSAKIIKNLDKGKTTSAGQIQKALDEIPQVKHPQPAVDKALDVPNAEIRATVVGKLRKAVNAAADAAVAAVDDTADVGRQLVDADALPPPPVSSPPPANRIKFDTVATPPKLYHGSRVQNLDLSQADPLVGAARSELGPGHYLSRDRGVAAKAANASVNPNLPPIEGRRYGNGSIHQVAVSGELIDGTKPQGAFGVLAEEAFAELPPEVGAVMRPALAGKKTAAEVFDAAAELLTEEQALAFSRALGSRIKAHGYAGISVNGRVVAVFDNAAIHTQRVSPVVRVANDASSNLTSRAALDEYTQTAIPSSKQARTFAAESKAKAAVQLQQDAGKKFAKEVRRVDEVAQQLHLDADSVFERVDDTFGDGYNLDAVNPGALPPVMAARGPGIRRLASDEQLDLFAEPTNFSRFQNAISEQYDQLPASIRRDIDEFNQVMSTPRLDRWKSAGLDYVANDLIRLHWSISEKMRINAAVNLEGKTLAEVVNAMPKGPAKRQATEALESIMRLWGNADVAEDAARLTNELAEAIGDGFTKLDEAIPSPGSIEIPTKPLPKEARLDPAKPFVSRKTNNRAWGESKGHRAVVLAPVDAKVSHTATGWEATQKQLDQLPAGSLQDLGYRTLTELQDLYRHAAKDPSSFNFKTERQLKQQLREILSGSPCDIF
jgi:hypothetical protein